MKFLKQNWLYLTIGLVVILGIVGGILIASKSVKKRSFMWGVMTREASLQDYTLEYWNKELDYDKKLGVNYIKVDYDAHAGYKRSVQMVQAAKAKGMDVLFTFAPADILKVKKPYDEGYALGKKLAGKLQGQVVYYQLMSESGSTALKGGQYTGTKESDYDQAKYQIIKEWLKGASDGVKSVDKKNQVVINDQWTHFAFFDMITRDGVKFDVLGWNWFSDMGFLGDKTLDGGQLVFDRLKEFKKPIILTEVNARPDSTKGMDEKVQSDFISKMADFAWLNKDIIKGFYILELTDQAPTQTALKKPEYYGLIYAKKATDGTYTFGELKKAFTTYQAIIKKYNK
ncbi:MAG: hypothetical protein WCP93_01570 [Candidatus Berkelbacteria bacterium]